MYNDNDNAASTTVYCRWMADVKLHRKTDSRVESERENERIKGSSLLSCFQSSQWKTLHALCFYIQTWFLVSAGRQFANSMLEMDIFCAFDAYSVQKSGCLLSHLPETIWEISTRTVCYLRTLKAIILSIMFFEITELYSSTHLVVVFCCCPAFLSLLNFRELIVQK